MPKYGTVLKVFCVALALGFLVSPGPASAGGDYQVRGHNGNTHGGSAYAWGFRKSANKSGGSVYYYGHKRPERAYKEFHYNYKKPRVSDGYRKAHKKGYKKAYKKGYRKGYKKALRQAHKNPYYFNGYKTPYYDRKHAKKHHGHHGKGHRKAQYNYDNACQKVTKVGYYNGYKVLWGGKGCYDSYGNFFIVKGSRHVVRYLH